MGKYVIEIPKKYYRASALIMGTDCGNIITEQHERNELEELTAEYVNEHFPELTEQAYERGKADATEDANMDNHCNYCKHFDKSEKEEPCNVCMYSYVSCFEQKQKEDAEIKVGDEVEFINSNDGRNGDIHVVSYVYGGKFDGIDDNGMTCEGCDVHEVRKTGKHYDIAALLAKMREGDA